MANSQPIRTLAHTTAAGIEVTDLKYSAGLHLPRHSHERAGFCLVLGGTYVEGYSSRDLRCGPQSVTFSPAGEEHRNDFENTAAHCLIIDVPQNIVDRADSAPLHAPFEEHSGQLAAIAERVLCEVHTSDSASPLAIEGLVMEMIAVASRRDHKPEREVPPAIRRVRDLLEARFAESLQLAEIAAAVDRHPVYVATSFRRAYGETIGACVRRLRIARVRQELASTSRPIADIALSAGFANQSHMTRLFHKATGMTPAVYRALIADNRQ